MSDKIIVPTLGESITEATVAKWLKKVGDLVKADEAVVSLETDKVSIDVTSPKAGVLSEILATEGSTVQVGSPLGTVGDSTSTPVSKKEKEQTKVVEIKKEEKQADKAPEIKNKQSELSPAVKRIIEEKNIDVSSVTGTGKDGRILKGDLVGLMGFSPSPNKRKIEIGEEERVKMTRLRATIAKRLKDAQNNAAILTTFNEVDMSMIIQIRKDNKDEFEKRYGVKLGFMSFFVKACVNALQSFPAVNAEVQGEEIVYKNYYNIGVAVGTDKGLVVPVLGNADELSFAEIEKEITNLGTKAKNNQLSIDELQGGTFTITNGGIYGSMLSTPIINPPQSGVLGMHNIVQRAVVINGKIEVRPIMYLALSYDHRIIDGRESVGFLVAVKEALENPVELLCDNNPKKAFEL